MTNRTLSLTVSWGFCLVAGGCSLSHGPDLPWTEPDDDGGLVVGDGDSPFPGDGDSESPTDGGVGQGGACPLGGAGGSDAGEDRANDSAESPDSRIAPPQGGAAPLDEPPATICIRIK